MKEINDQRISNRRALVISLDRQIKDMKLIQLNQVEGTTGHSQVWADSCTWEWQGVELYTNVDGNNFRANSKDYCHRQAVKMLPLLATPSLKIEWTECGIAMHPPISIMVRSCTVTRPSGLRKHQIISQLAIKQLSHSCQLRVPRSHRISLYSCEA